MDNKNIIYGSFVGIAEHLMSVAPRTIIDFKQYYNTKSQYKTELEKINIKNNYLRLYKGTIPYLSGVALSHTWLFYFLEKSKKQNNTYYDLIYGSLGRLGHDVFMVPGDTIRMVSNIKNLNTIQSYNYIVKNKGFSGLFKGVLPSVLNNIPIGAIEFSVLMYLNRKYKDEYNPYVYGLATGILSSIVSSPLDTVKTMVQLNHNSIYNSCVQVYKDRGFLGFFRSIPLRTFQCCISYGTYEWLCKNLNLNIEK